jgi:hypothetical protein
LLSYPSLKPARERASIEKSYREKPYGEMPAKELAVKSSNLKIVPNEKKASF